MDLWSDAERAYTAASRAYQKILYPGLRALKESGVEIHYVIGNHDAALFDAFLPENVAEHFPGVQHRIKESHTIQAISEGWQPLYGVATVHYPGVILASGTNKNILLTHGHYHQWEWLLVNGRPDLPLGTIWSILRWIPVVTLQLGPLTRRAYVWYERIWGGIRNAIAHPWRSLRELAGNHDLHPIAENAQQQDWTMLMVPPMEGPPVDSVDKADPIYAIAIAVTNTILRTLDNPALLAALETGTLCEMVMIALAEVLFRAEEPTDTRATWLVGQLRDHAHLNPEHHLYKIVQPLWRGLLSARGWHARSTPLGIVRDIRGFIANHPQEPTFTIAGPEVADVRRDDFSSLSIFNDLIIGHRHQPQYAQDAHFADNGALLTRPTPIRSSLSITKQDYIHWTQGFEPYQPR